MSKLCFAKEKNGNCKILEFAECKFGDCPFYKTQEQLDESYKKAKERLASLEERTQQAIAQKYYNGKKKW